MNDAPAPTRRRRVLSHLAALPWLPGAAGSSSALAVGAVTGSALLTGDGEGAAGFALGAAAGLARTVGPCGDTFSAGPRRPFRK